MSGLKTIFQKSEIYLTWQCCKQNTEFEGILTCETGRLPIPVDEKRIRNGDWHKTV